MEQQKNKAKKNKPVATRSLSSRAKARLECLQKREKRLADRIVKLEKQRDYLPKLIEELKAKHKQAREQKEKELKDIQKLIEAFKASGGTDEHSS